MPRLGHKKSRLGCRQCKARHVKCDELKPCSNCARYGVACSLSTWEPAAPQSLAQASSGSSVASHHRPTPATKAEKTSKSPSATSSPALPIDHVSNSSAASPQDGTTAAATSEGSSPSSQSDQFPFLSKFIHRSEAEQADLWVRDLDLMHHWTTQACKALSLRPDSSHAWQNEAPQEAVTHTFLMHEILALSAFHKAYKKIEQRSYYYACGIHHQDAAIRGIRQKLHNVTPFEAPAIVAASTLLTISVFASTGFEAQFPKTANLQSPIDDILNIFHLMQGLGSVLSIARQHIADSFLAPILRCANAPTPAQPLFRNLEQRLPVLVAFIEGKCDLADLERVAYLEAISALGSALKMASGENLDNRELRFLFSWPLFLKPTYLLYLREQRQGALVVLSHYAFFYLIAGHKHWYLEGWGDRLMNTCRNGVDPTWMSAMQWAMSFLDHNTTEYSSDQWAQQRQAPADELHLADLQNLSMSESYREQSNSSLHLSEEIPGTSQKG